MQLAFDYDVNDWMSFQRYHLAHSPASLRTRIINRILFPVLAVVLIVTHNATRRQFDFSYFWPFAIISVVWMLFYPAYTEWRAIGRRKRILLKDEKSGGGSRFGHRVVELLPDAVLTAEEMGESSIKAAAISRVVETPNELLLYLGSTQAIILPRKKIDPALFAEAVAFAREHYARDQQNPAK